MLLLWINLQQFSLLFGVWSSKHIEVDRPDPCKAANHHGPRDLTSIFFFFFFFIHATPLTHGCPRRSPPLTPSLYPSLPFPSIFPPPPCSPSHPLEQSNKKYKKAIFTAKKDAILTHPRCSTSLQGLCICNTGHTPLGLIR